MNRGRFVVLGLAQPRAEWFHAVARWANESAIPVEFLKCLSPEELRARLQSGRPHSAVLADSSLPGVDRDLLVTAADHHCPVIIVESLRAPRDWKALGAVATIAATFDRVALIEALTEHSELVPWVTAETTITNAAIELPPWRARIVAVLGPGGTGVSTIATAAAQALGEDARYGGSVLLADLRREAEQAMLHDTGTLSPGVQELVESHRAGQPSSDDVRSMAFPVAARSYDLLLGLRRARFWPSIRPAAFSVAFASLAAAWQALVVDCDSDIEGEELGGSIDIEDRNVMARTATRHADAVLVVGHPSMKGVHALTRLLGELDDASLPVDRVVPIVNQTPRSPRVRAEVTRAIEELCPWRNGVPSVPEVSFVPRRNVEQAFRDGARLPSAVVEPVRAALARIESSSSDERISVAGAADLAARRVVPGSLGSWGGDPGVVA